MGSTSVLTIRGFFVQHHNCTTLTKNRFWFQRASLHNKPRNCVNSPGVLCDPFCGLLKMVEEYDRCVEGRFGAILDFERYFDLSLGDAAEIGERH